MGNGLDSIEAGDTHRRIRFHRQIVNDEQIVRRLLADAATGVIPRETNLFAFDLHLCIGWRLSGVKWRFDS